MGVMQPDRRREWMYRRPSFRFYLPRGVLCSEVPAAILLLTVLAAPLAVPVSLPAQEGGASGTVPESPPAAKPQWVDPRLFGVDLPPGQRVEGGGRRVLVSDDSSAAIVGRIHVEVGDYRLIMLPDGRFVARSKADSPLTERPFEPATKEQLAEQLTTGPLADFKTRQTRRYLYIYDTSDAFAVATSRIMETMFPGVVYHAQAQRIDVHPPELPMVVIMFRTEEQFQRYRRMPPGVVAYYDPVTNHVVMYEESSRPVRRDLALRQAISTIAHEGAHQILHNIGVQQRLSRWPMWVSEGLAEYFAPTSMDERMKWKGAGQVNDLRMFELERYVQSRAADEPQGDLVQHTVLAARLTSTGYASAWALTHFLARQYRSEFYSYIREVSRLGPLEGAVPAGGQGVVAENWNLFERHFGDDAADLERRLVLHLKNLPYRDPFADFPHYVGLAIYQQAGRQQRDARLFHTADLARQWQQQLAEKLGGNEGPSLKSEIREFPNRARAERFTQLWLRGR